MKYISHSKQSVMKETIFKCLTFFEVSESIVSSNHRDRVICQNKSGYDFRRNRAAPLLLTMNKNVLFIQMWRQDGRSTGFNAMKLIQGRHSQADSRSKCPGSRGGLQRTSHRAPALNPQRQQRGSAIQPTPYLNGTVLSVQLTRSSSRTPGLSSWHLPSQMLSWIRPMTPPQGSAGISRIPHLHLGF